ncbi:MAG: Bcr/CflA family multidrug efflux transporter [Herbaspirillum sp.]|nr:Bcr/CflA family multidrug efflux transporter [Herbaspirillum sp.]
MAALTAIGSLSIDMYLPSFPAMAADLGVGANMVQLTLASFLIGLAVGQLFYGPFSDRFGRKPPLYFAIGLYAVASCACVFVRDVETLIVLRFFQGLGGCGGFVISRAVIRDKMGAEGSARAFSLMMLVFGVAPILAPLFGGLVLTLWGWRSIFVALTVFAAICLVAMHHVMDESRDPQHVQPLHLGRICRQYWGLLKDRQFMSYALCGGLVQAGLFAYIAGSPFVLIELHGIPAQYYGLVFGANAIGLIGASQINARLVIKRPLDRILNHALTVAVIVSMSSALAVAAGIDSLPLLLVCLFFYLAAYGMISPNAMAIVLKHQGKQAGTASALMGTLQFGLGVLSGICMSMWNTKSALPLTSVMALCGLSAFLLYHLVAKKQSSPATAI